MFLYEWDKAQSSSSKNTVMKLADYATITGQCSTFTLEDCSGNTLEPISDLSIDSAGTITVTNDREFSDTACINACGTISTQFVV